MRLLTLLVLFCNVCFAQKFKDYTKMTAYRVIEISTHPPCSVVDFIKSNEYGSVFTASSKDRELIKNLLLLKDICKKWQRSNHDCHQKNKISYGDFIPNMFVFESSYGNDTIYTTENNKSIVIPSKNIQYHAPNDEINSVLKGDIKNFFERDFQKDIWFSIIGQFDSIPIKKFLFKDRTINSISDIKDISSDAEIIKVERGLIEGIIVEDREYRFNDNIYSFKHDGRLESIVINNSADYYIDGINIGDDEGILLSKYPNSTTSQFPYGSDFAEIKDNYAYVIKVENNTAKIYFSIHKKKIQIITLHLKP